MTVSFGPIPKAADSKLFISAFAFGVDQNSQKNWGNSLTDIQVFLFCVHVSKTTRICSFSVQKCSRMAKLKRSERRRGGFLSSHASICSRWNIHQNGLKSLQNAPLHLQKTAVNAWIDQKRENRREMDAKFVSLERSEQLELTTSVMHATIHSAEENRPNFCRLSLKCWPKWAVC